jgi:small subunit ribosomal protein S29e
MPNKLFMTHPRNFGKDSRPCRVCTNRRGVISKYDLQMCRKCFREQAPFIGFTKFWIINTYYLFSIL